MTSSTHRPLNSGWSLALDLLGKYGKERAEILPLDKYVGGMGKSRFLVVEVFINH